MERQLASVELCVQDDVWHARANEKKIKDTERVPLSLFLIPIQSTSPSGPQSQREKA